MTKLIKNTKYFNFPLCFLQMIDNENQALNKICNWAIVKYSKTIDYDTTAVAKQIVYMFYRQRDNLLYQIEKKINEMIENEDFIIDEDYNGFNFDGGNFEPENGEVEALVKEFKEDPEFKDYCFKQCQYMQVKNILNLDIKKGSIENAFEIFKELNSFLNEFERTNGGDVWTSVKTTYLFDARDGQLPVDLFRLVCAVKSIIGKRNFNKTYKKIILSRMFGAKKEHLIPPENKDEYNKLSRRRQWNNLIDKAEQRNLLTFIPANRGYFVSIKYSDEKLRDEVIKRTKRSKRKMRIIQYPKKLQLNEISRN